MLLSYIRTLVLYLVLIAVIRVMGKRQVGQMEPSEFVVTMLIANLASIPMQDGGIPLYSGLVPMLTILAAELVLSFFTLRSIRIRRLLCGKPVILIENGRLLQEHLRSTRVTMDELMGHLRLKDVLDIRDVQYAILETNGSLSVFPWPGVQPAGADDAKIKVPERSLPVTLVQDGNVFSDDLRRTGKDLAWLEKTLASLGATVERTLLLSIDGQGSIHFIKKEG